jgi:F420-dependent oxidoreductase-like protein
MPGGEALARGYGDGMDVGVHFMNFTLSGGPEALRFHVRDTAEAAEAAGCTMFTCMDHYFQMEAFTQAEDPMLEGYTTLGYVAGRTDTMLLGLLVTGVSYRYPGLLAKIVTTLDVLSGGRAMLGLGAAWYEREHLGLGVPFYPIAERLERLEETLQICLQMWSDDNGPYCGAHYQLAETLNVPPPVRRPRPPILIGGGGERKLLRFVARYADMNNLFSASPEQVQHKLDVLARHCEEIGRDRSEIKNTTIARIGPDIDVDAFVASMAALAALGMEHVQISLLTDEPARLVTGKLTEIVRRLAELP